MKRLLLLVVALLLASWLTAVVLGQERPAASQAEPLARVVEKIGAAVERYQGGLFSVAYTERVVEERLKRDLKAREGKAKEYVFENVVLRGPSKGGGEEPPARNVRRLKSEDGRAAEPGKPYVRPRPNKCGGPRGPAESYTDPLTFLLPKNHARHEFADEGEATVDGRAARVVRVVPRGQGPARVESNRDCFWAVVPYEARVWADAESGEVLRLEWRLAEPYAFESPRAMKVGGLRFGPRRKLKYERVEAVTRFRRVEFKDPAQTLLLPASAETLRVIEGADRPRVRTTQTFTDYRRFVSDVKVVADEDEPRD